MDQYADSSAFNNVFSFEEDKEQKDTATKVRSGNRHAIRQQSHSGRLDQANTRSGEEDSLYINPFADKPYTKPLKADSQKAVATQKGFDFFSGMQKPTPVAPWELVLVALAVLLTGTTRRYYTGRFQNILKAAIQRRVGYQVIREEKLYSHPGQVLLMVTSMLVLSLFAYKVIAYFNTDMLVSGFPLYLGIFLSVITLTTLRVLAFTATGQLFAIDKEVEEYIFNLSVFNVLSSFLLLPIILLMLAFPEWMHLLFLLAGLGFAGVTIWRLARALKISVSGRYQFYYIILYLCTLEILPLVVIIKLLVNGIS